MAAVTDTLAYAPSEGLTSHLSRVYDIWSMGCILLEVVVYILYDKDLVKTLNDVQNFANERSK